jgi:hypothetical protein
MSRKKLSAENAFWLGWITACIIAAIFKALGYKL